MTVSWRMMGNTWSINVGRVKDAASDREVVNVLGIEESMSIVVRKLHLDRGDGSPTRNRFDREWRG